MSSILPSTRAVETTVYSITLHQSLSSYHPLQQETSRDWTSQTTSTRQTNLDAATSLPPDFSARPTYPLRFYRARSTPLCAPFASRVTLDHHPQRLRSVELQYLCRAILALDSRRNSFELELISSALAKAPRGRTSQTTETTSLIHDRGILEGTSLAHQPSPTSDLIHLHTRSAT
jgi:hypothetical protein